MAAPLSAAGRHSGTGIDTAVGRGVSLAGALAPNAPETGEPSMSATGAAVVVAAAAGVAGGSSRGIVRAGNWREGAGRAGAAGWTAPSTPVAVRASSTTDATRVGWAASSAGDSLITAAS